MTAIFVSYRRSDTAYTTDTVYAAFSNRFDGIKIFRDVEEITLGLDFLNVIDDALSSCTVMVVMIGKEWLAVKDSKGNRRLDDETDFVRIEVEQALQRGIPVIPVLVEGAEMPNAEELPSSMQQLCRRNAARLRPAPDFNADLRRLGNAVEEHLKRSGLRKNRILRNCFLLFPMQNQSARRARGFFYGLLLFGLFGISDVLLSEEVSEDLFGPGERWQLWFGGLIFICISVVARQLAVGMEKNVSVQ